jgi:hypothetical protein
VVESGGGRRLAHQGDRLVEIGQVAGVFESDPQRSTEVGQMAEAVGVIRWCGRDHLAPRGN